VAAKRGSASPGGSDRSGLQREHDVTDVTCWACGAELVIGIEPVVFNCSLTYDHDGPHQFLLVWTADGEGMREPPVS
jgi:hypothetical protein